MILFGSLESREGRKKGLERRFGGLASDEVPWSGRCPSGPAVLRMSSHDSPASIDHRASGRISDDFGPVALGQSSAKRDHDYCRPETPCDDDFGPGREPESKRDTLPHARPFVLGPRGRERLQAAGQVRQVRTYVARVEVFRSGTALRVYQLGHFWSFPARGHRECKLSQSWTMDVKMVVFCCPQVA